MQTCALYNIISVAATAFVDYFSHCKEILSIDRNPSGKLIIFNNYSNTWKYNKVHNLYSNSRGLQIRVLNNYVAFV